MKKLCLIFSLCPVFLWGQVKINFEQGLPEGMEQHPSDRWGASSEDPLEGTYSLRHIYDNSSSATDAVSFRIEEPNRDSLIQCHFIIDYQYRPSASNNWCFYFLSDGNAEAIAMAETNSAIMLGVNQTGSDDSLRVYYREGNKTNELLTCKLHFENDLHIQPWQFEIGIDPELGLQVKGGPYPGIMELLGQKQEFQIPDIPLTHIGLSYTYTSSKDRLLGVDNIVFKSTPLLDTIPPDIDSIRILSANLLEFQFNEKIFMNSTDIKKIIRCNYRIDTLWIMDNSLFLRFPDRPKREEHINYEITGLSDRKGNTRIYNGSFFYFYPDRHDIIFTEIMADPSPSVYLPELEYIEIYNRCGYEINLAGWKLITGKKEWLLPQIILFPGDYHFFTYGNEYSVPSVGENYTPIFSSSSVISNVGQDLLIYTSDDILIDAVKYSRSWYDDDFKNEGGWSLERIDLTNLCGGGEIWKASESFLGGTPGAENSLNETVHDSQPPFIQQVIYENDSVFRLKFNETLDKNAFHTYKPAIISENPNIVSLDLQEPFFSECRLEIRQSGVKTPLVFTNVWRDCSGNTLRGRDSIYLGYPEKPLAGSIIISEVLFSPWPGCPEFIELYNNSSEIMCLYDIKIHISDGEESSAGGKFVTEEKVLFFPGTFLVLAKDPMGLIPFYDLPPHFNYQEFQNMPSLPDKGGRIAIYNRGNVLIDEMIYSNSEQFPLLADFHGVSLERIFLDSSPGINSEWHSASSLSGFATPGRLNSQNVNVLNRKPEFSCEYKVFSPDNDGYRDLAVLNIKMEREGYVAMIRVFDASGRQVRVLGNSELLGTEETIFWDGRDEAGRICPSGIYLVYMETYHLSGSKKAFKETVVLKR